MPFWFVGFLMEHVPLFVKRKVHIWCRWYKDGFLLCFSHSTNLSIRAVFRIVFSLLSWRAKCASQASHIGGFTKYFRFIRYYKYMVCSRANPEFYSKRGWIKWLWQYCNLSRPKTVNKCWILTNLWFCDKWLWLNSTLQKKKKNLCFQIWQYWQY